MTNKFTFIDCFSGIGGFRRGLEANGGTCVFSSEIDKFASQAYEVLYGEKPHGDITEIDAKDMPDHDVLAGGFPCQAFSVAGKRGGFEDARGTLFFEIARIASEKQPKMLLLENVKGLVGHDKGRTLDTIIKTLNDIGYRVDFDVLNSKYFGVPQNRERIFIVAIREDLVPNEPWSEDSMKGQLVVPKGKRRISGYDDVKTFNFDFPTNETVTTRLRDILESNVDEKYYLSDEKTEQLVSQLTEKSLEQSDEFMVDDQGRTKKPLNPLEVSPTLRRETHGNEPRIVQPQIDERQTVIDDTQGFDGVRTYDDETPTLRSERHGLKVAEKQTPVQYNRKDGIGKELNQANTISASDWRGLNRNQNQNAVLEEVEVRPVLTPDRAEKRQNGRRFKEDGEESITLTSQDRHGVALREIIEENVREIASKSRPNEEIEINFKENGDIRPHRTDARKSGLSELNINHEDNPSFTVSAAHSPKVYGNKTHYRIRKLTPLECWRLQGFPDEAHDAVEAAGISDSQRYKMAGNAVTVNVVEAIGERLLPYLAD